MKAVLLGGLALLGLGSRTLAQEPEEAYKHLLQTWKKKAYKEALALAETFVKKHPDYKHIPAALYMGGTSGLQVKAYDRAEPFYRKLLQDHPTYKKARPSRDHLVGLLFAARKLQACIDQCDANLKADPGAPKAVRWKSLRARCLFRLWRFEEARKAFDAFLEAHGDSPEAKDARLWRSRIDPDWQRDAHGVVKGYAGKYVEDVRFQDARKRLPAMVEEAYACIEERLGVDIRGKSDVIFVFEDAGDRAVLAGETYTIGLKGKPATVILLRAEYMVISPEDFRLRVIHEFKHAGFRGILGQAYLAHPKWVREGLAVWGSGQLPARKDRVLNNTAFAGRDPRKILDGITDRNRTADDYLEDALAFAWLERHRSGSVKTFCRRLIAGESHTKIFGDLAGVPFEEAIRKADAFCKAQVLAWTGSAYGEYERLQSRTFDILRQGDKTARAWLEGEGMEAYEKWFQEHPEHPLGLNLRYRMGKSLVRVGSHEKGRSWLLPITDFQRCTCVDDALFWIGRSHELAGDEEGARKVFGVLLRDFSWSKVAKDVRDRYQAAGPEKKRE
ncbi:MAG: tetratricopeptide repeat protein [Planctomycetota bacterium]|jgi:TolA-binding protein